MLLSNMRGGMDAEAVCAGHRPHARDPARELAIRQNRGRPVVARQTVTAPRCRSAQRRDLPVWRPLSPVLAYLPVDAFVENHRVPLGAKGTYVNPPDPVL